MKRGVPKNGIAVHVRKNDHSTTVQHIAAVFWQRRTVEAIWIRRTTPSMNLDSGLLLSMVWNSILNPPHTPHPITPPSHTIHFMFKLLVLFLLVICYMLPHALSVAHFGHFHTHALLHIITQALLPVLKYTT